MRNEGSTDTACDSTRSITQETAPVNQKLTHVHRPFGATVRTIGEPAANILDFGAAVRYDECRYERTDAESHNPRIHPTRAAALPRVFSFVLAPECREAVTARRPLAADSTLRA